MTQQEYEKAKAECWIEFCKEHPIETPSISIGEAFAYAFDLAFALGKQEKDADTVIQGWVARDKDGEIYLYEDKPVQCSDEWAGRLHPEFDFQKLRWTSDPIEVELIIKRKKK